MMRSVSIHGLWFHWLLVLITAVPSFAAGKLILVVGGDHQNPPFEFLKQGAPTGFNVELMRAVALEMGVDVEIRLGPWAEVRTALEQGKIDALAGMCYSEKRSRQVDFSLFLDLTYGAIQDLFDYSPSFLCNNGVNFANQF